MASDAPSFAPYVERTNLQHILNTSLAEEYAAVVARIEQLESDLALRKRYRDWLATIAADSGIAVSRGEAVVLSDRPVPRQAPLADRHVGRVESPAERLRLAGGNAA